MSNLIIADAFRDYQKLKKILYEVNYVNNSSQDNSLDKLLH